MHAPLATMSIAHRLRYFWYLVGGIALMPSVRLGKSWWDQEYVRDGLARTEGDVELPRHLLVAALTRQYAPGGSILDVGCGTGGVTIPLRASFADRALCYLGLDYSVLALEQASARCHGASSPGAATVEFLQADFESFVPPRAFDAIIFSESLYYAADPLETVRRMSRWLTPGGIVVVSMWRRPSRRRVWRALQGALRELSRSRLAVPRRPAWDIVVYSIGDATLLLATDNSSLSSP